MPLSVIDYPDSVGKSDNRWSCTWTVPRKLALQHYRLWNALQATFSDAPSVLIQQT